LIMKIKHYIQKTFETTDGYDGSESPYRTFADNIPGIVYRVFIKENKRMQFFNDMLKPMTGYRAGELIKGAFCSIESMIIPEDRQDVKAVVKKAVMGNKIFEVEYRLKCKNGDIRYFIERGKPIYEKDEPLYIDGVILDITERKQAEEALRESEEKLAGILASVTDHMSMIDDQHNIVWANDFAKKLFGEDIIGRKCYNVYQRYDKPCKSCVVRRCFEDENIHEQEIESILADESRKIFWNTASVAVRDKDGRAILVVEVSRDITERKKAEKELKELNVELEQRVEARTSELLKSTQELLDTNNAIAVLAKNIDKNKEEVEKKIALTINSNIMPIVENLRNYKALKNHRVELDVLVAYLQDITSSLLNGSDIIVQLSSSEMRIATMIKNGLTSKEIAGKSCISLNTVKTHRRNIRKKLNIHNSDINLANYLRQKWW